MEVRAVGVSPGPAVRRPGTGAAADPQAAAAFAGALQERTGGQGRQRQRSPERTAEAARPGGEPAGQAEVGGAVGPDKVYGAAGTAGGAAPGPIGRRLDLRV